MGAVRIFATPGTYTYKTPGTGTMTVEALGVGGGNGGTGGRSLWLPVNEWTARAKSIVVLGAA